MGALPRRAAPDREENGMNRHTTTFRIARAFVLVAAASLLAGLPAAAQQNDPAANYPNGPVKILVTVSAGGGVDTVTRIIAEKLNQRWRQPVVVENRVGGGGNIAG